MVCNSFACTPAIFAGERIKPSESSESVLALGADKPLGEGKPP